MEKTPQAENLFEVLFQSPLKQQNIINLPKFQGHGIVESATSDKKALTNKLKFHPRQSYRMGIVSCVHLVIKKFKIVVKSV